MAKFSASLCNFVARNSSQLDIRLFLKVENIPTKEKGPILLAYILQQAQTTSRWSLQRMQPEMKPILEWLTLLANYGEVVVRSI